MRIDEILAEIYDDNKYLKNRGKVANYIPELSKSNIDDLAIVIYDNDGKEYKIGDFNRKFTIQSVSKILSLALAIEDNGIEKVLSKVDIKPTTDKFNQFYKLGLKGYDKPSNPMINIGAISITSLIKGSGDKKIERLLKFIREITENQDINYNEDVYLSEKQTGFRNKSMAYMLKEIGNIEGNPDIVLDSYFKQCSIELNSLDLGKISYFFATHGRRYSDKKQLMDKKIIRLINSVMATSGMYNYSGEYAAKVGIPSKSGVSGCILGVVPNNMGIAVYSPGLDEYGNSFIGSKVMYEISEQLNLSIY